MEKLTNAFLLISKPYGITSRKFLNEISKVVNEKRIGHLGTLDPMATGLLFVALGKYTRLLPLVEVDTKEYVIEITFGIETDTWDLMGKVKKSVNVNVSENDILKVLPEFVGEIKQKVPFFSAKKLNGVELYKLARKETFIETFTQIKIYGIEYLGLRNNKLTLRVTSNKGAYMRSLAYEIGERIGVPATLSAITRVKLGELSIKDATTINRLKKGELSKGIIQPNKVISLPSIILKDKTNFISGKKEKIERVLVFDENQKLIGLGNLKDNSISPKIVIDEDIEF